MFLFNFQDKKTEARYELLLRNEVELEGMNSSLKQTDAPPKSTLSILPSQEKIVHHTPTKEGMVSSLFIFFVLMLPF